MKELDQPEKSASGKLTENGKFHHAAQQAKDALAPPRRVHVYEKIQPGIWSYNGVFHLIDSWREHDGVREVFKFKMALVDGDASIDAGTPDLAHHRIIPSWVKLAVWKRDEGKCVQCGATDNLHYDHILPFSKGGTSVTPENIQLLCARHNLRKGSRIE